MREAGSPVPGGGGLAELALEGHGRVLARGMGSSSLKAGCRFEKFWMALKAAVILALG